MKWKDDDELAKVRLDTREGRTVMIVTYDGVDVCWYCGDPLQDEVTIAKFVGEREVILHAKCGMKRPREASSVISFLRKLVGKA